MAHVAAAAAAAEARRKQQEEEEALTPYSREDLENDFEFKIVRAQTGVFGKPEVFKRLLEEEARAGWQMVEKFDNTRVRFKRPLSARQRDAMLPAEVDPYRVQYGMSEGAVAGVVIGIIFGGIALAVGGAALIERLLR